MLYITELILIWCIELISKQRCIIKRALTAFISISESVLSSRGSIRSIEGGDVLVNSMRHEVNTLHVGAKLLWNFFEDFFS